MLREGNPDNCTSAEGRSVSGYFRAYGLLAAPAALAALFISQPGSAQEPEKKGLGLIVGLQIVPQTVARGLRFLPEGQGVVLI